MRAAGHCLVVQMLYGVLTNQQLQRCTFWHSLQLLLHLFQQ
jgi:hypothetical protein